MKSFYCFLLLITICQLVASDQVFKATKEWQKVPEGVNIPKGLHVRMDFQTHEKWAKLMDEDGSETEEGVIAMVDPEKPTKVKFEDEKLQALKEEFDKLDKTTPYALMEDLIDDLETNPDPNGQNFEAITDGLDSHFSHIDLARDAVKDPTWVCGFGIMECPKLKA